MRLRLRAAGFFALAVVAITCTDAPTSPRDARGGALSARHLSMSPSFSPAAAKAYSNLAAFGLDVTEVHVHLTGPDGSVRDTTINFPVGQDTLVIDIPVDAGGTDQTFTALLELRNADHVVLFSGTQTVVARTVSLVSDVPAIVVIQVALPDARTKTVAVTPADSSVGASATVPVRATAVDSAGAAVTDLRVRWTSSDATLATVTTTGNTTASVVGQGRRGVATISAITLTGITGTSRIAFVPPPARVVVVSGGAQTGVAGSLLAAPFVVEVQAADNLPVSGAPITFRAVTAGGAVTTLSAVSDALGRASTTLTLGKTGGTYQYEVASGSLPAVQVTETATPAPPAAVEIASGNSQVDSVGRTLPLPLVVKVTDQFGGAASGATVYWTRVSGAGAVGAVTSTSGSDGLASTTYTLGNTIGAETISAVVTGISGSAGTTTFTASAISRGAAAIAMVSGGSQSGAPGVTLPTPLVARVADILNNPVANATVAWSTPSAGTTFTPASSVTDALGQVTTSVKLGTVAGPVVVSATTGALVATANLSIVAGPAAIIAKQAGDAQVAEVATNVAVAPSVKVTDASGNAIAGAAVVFSVASGGGSVSAASTTTDASGVATLGSWKLGNSVGANTLTATSGALTATFSATGKSGSAAKLAFVAAPPASIAVGAAIPAVTARIVDALDNAVASAGVNVTATGVTSPGGFTTTLTVATDATGLATFALPPYVGPTGTAILTLSAPSLASVASSSITVSAGAAAKLAITTQPSPTAASGAALVAQPVIQLTDAGGNAASVAGVSVTAAIGSGSGTLSGTQTVVSTAAGLVTFTNLAISGAAGPRTLAFSATGLTGATSNTITLAAGAAATMTKNAGDAQTATAGSAVAVAPSVLVKDAAGNPVAGAAVTFAVASGGGSLTGPTTTTNASGIATVGSWTLGNAAGSNSLTATSGAFTATFTATGTSGSAAKLAFVTAPPASITVGTTATTFTVQIQDALNNAVAANGVTLTGTGVITPGGFTANYTAITDATGLATFTVPVYNGPLGSAIITVNGASLTSVASSPIALLAGAAAKLAITTQPSAIAASGAALVAQPVVQLRDAGNNSVNVAGVAVTAAIVSGGGTLSGTQTVTSSSAGVVTFTDLAISGTAGPRTLAFTATGLTGVTSNAITLGAGAAAAMTKNAGDAQTATAGSAVAVAPSVIVKDASGNPVAGAPVTFAVASGGGALTGPTTTTNASGIATVGSWTLGNAAGPNSLTAGSGSFAATFTATGTAGAGAKLAFVTLPPSSITVGVASPAFTVRITDALNNAVASAGVSVTGTVVVTPGGATATYTGTTDATGLATFTLPVYAGSTGSAIITMTATGLTSVASSPITLVAGAPAKLAVASQPSATVASGVALAAQPTVQLRDAGDNNVSVGGVAVTAAIAAGGGTLSGTVTVTSSAAGLATFTNLAISGTAGPHTLSFVASGLAPAASNTITLTAGAAAVMTKNAGDLQTATAGSAVEIAPSVLVKDAAGNPVAGAPVTFAVASGGGALTLPSATTNGSGIATVGSWTLGNAAGANTITATSGALSATFTATATAGAAAKLTFVAAPPASITVGAAIPTISAQITDALNNAVASAGVTVTATGVTTPGGFTTTATATTNAGGLATFTLPAYAGPTGTAVITMTSSGLASVASSPITLLAGAAAKLAITLQPSATAASGAALVSQPVVQLRDVGNNNVSAGGVAVTAAIASGGGTLSGTLTVPSNAAGVATFTDLVISGSSGPRTLAFTATGLASATSNAITLGAGAAAGMTKNAGDAQTATAGSAVAVAPSVIVKDAAGNPVAGAPVTFAIASGGGTLTGPTTTTNASGIATVGSWTLGSAAGPNTLTATSGALSVTFTATGTAGAAAKMAFTVAPPASVASGAVMAPAVQVQMQDTFGNPASLSGASISARLISGTGTLTGNVAVTNASGLATFPSLALDGVAGPFRLEFSQAAILLNSATLTLTPGAASKLAVKVAGSNTATSGSPLAVQPVIVVTDASGNQVAQSGVVVTATIKSGSGSLISATATSDGTGAATFSGLSISGIAGPFTLHYQAAGLAAVDGASIALSAGAAAVMTKNAGDLQTATAGSAVAVAPSVLVKDAAGNAVAGAPVTFAVASGGGALTGPTTTTNASGIATVGSWTLGNAAGANTLTATSGALSATFTATGAAGAAAKLAFVAVPPASITVGAAIPTISAQITDALNNAVASAGVTVTATGVTTPGGFTTTATATTNAGGLATFALPVYTGPTGTAILTLSASGLTSIASSPITIAAGAPAKLAIATQPSTTASSGAVLATQPVIQLSDAGGNNANVSGVSVTATIASGGGTLGGTVTKVSSASGLVTFTDLAISGLAGGRTLGFSATGLTGITSGTITLGAGAAAAMTKNAGDAQTATAGSTVEVAPSVIVSDAAGNPVAGAPVTFAIASGGGSLTVPTTTTNASGIATVGSWKLGNAAGANSLTATSGSFSVTFTATGAAGAAVMLLDASQLPSSITVGAPILPTPLKARVADALGNPVSTILPVTLSYVVSPSGTTFSTTVNTDASGVASFTLSPYVGPIGTMTIDYGSPTLTGQESAGIPVLVGAPASLAISTQPPATAASGAVFGVSPTVQVVDAGGNSVSQGGLTVTAGLASGAGTLSGATATTNSGGLATFSTISIAGAVGPRTLSFTSGSLVSPTSGTVTITAGAPASISKSAGDAQTAIAGAAVAIAPQVRVLDASNNPVAGVSVTFAVASGGGTLTGTNPATTDASGFASIGSWKLGTVAGPNTLTATAGALSASFSATGTAGAAAGLRFASGVPSTITVGASFASPVNVQLIDAGGNAVSSASTLVALNLTVSPSGASFNLSATTDATGLASFTLSPYNGQVGTAILTSTATGLTAATSGSIPVVAGGVSKILIVTQPSSNAVNGVAFAVQPAVQLADAGGNPVGGVVNIVALKGVAGGYTLGGTTSAATDASGLATFSTLRFDGLAGVYSLKFTFSGGPTSLATNSITLAAGAGTALSITTQPSAAASSGAAFATQPVIQLTDASGNPVPTAGVVVTASIASGSGSLANATATTVAGGAATFSGLAITGSAGNFTLNFDAPSYSTAASNPIAVGAGVAAKLLVTTGFSDGQSGVPFGTQPVVRVLDSGDNPVLQAGIPIGVSIATGGGALSGTTTVNTNASGVAAFTDLVVTGAAGPRTFAFSGPSLATINFGPVTVSAGVAAKLVFSTSPSTTATNAVPLAVQPVVQLVDGADNPVATAGVTVTATFPSESSGTLSGATATTDATGKATFSGLTITGLVSSYTVRFAAGSFTPVTAGAIALTPGAPKQLKFTQQPTNAIQGVAISPPMQVALGDVSGNTVPNSTDLVFLSITPGTGSNDAAIRGTTFVALSNGVATFSDVNISLPSPGYSLTASIDLSGVANGISNTFDITSAPRPTIITQTGSQVAVLPHSSIPPGTITFLARDASLRPLVETLVNFSGSRADCSFGEGATTNASGVVTVAVATDSMTAGCTVIATLAGADDPATAQITTVPYVATHAWFGGASGQPNEYDLAANWVNISTKANEIPGSGSTPYVPLWPTLNFPTASSNKVVAGLYSDPGAYLDLAGHTLRTSSNVNAAVLGGMTTATGSGVTLRGQFDSLTAGIAGSCVGAAVSYVVADSVFVPGKVNVACGLVSRNLSTDGLVTSVPGAFVKIPASGFLAADSVFFRGDSIVIDVGGTALLGDADIAGLLRIQNGSLFVTRTSTFGGAGTADSAFVELFGDVAFTGASRSGYRFTSGLMYLLGNFDQTNSRGSAFQAQPDQFTYFLGSAKQSVNFAAPSINRFGTVVSNNTDGVNLLSSVTLASGDIPSWWYAFQSPVTVPAATTLTIPGSVYFQAGGTMRVDGTVTLASCFKDVVTNPFSGTGSVNGIRPPIEFSCSFVGGGDAIEARSSALGRPNIPPAGRLVRPPVVRRPPLVRKRAAPNRRAPAASGLR